MNVYTTDKIRNVVLLGHGGAGKTSLAEAMAYLAGITSRMGKVEDGNTISDFDKEEQKRHFSISTTTIPLEWDGHKITCWILRVSLILLVKLKRLSALLMQRSSLFQVRLVSRLEPRRHGTFVRSTRFRACSS